MTVTEDHTKRPLEKLEIDLDLFSSGTIESLVRGVTDVSPGVASYREVFTTEARSVDQE